jgi:hypothetical protein
MQEQRIIIKNNVWLSKRKFTDWGVKYINRRRYIFIKLKSWARGEDLQTRKIKIQEYKKWVAEFEKRNGWERIKIKCLKIIIVRSFWSFSCSLIKNDWVIRLTEITSRFYKQPSLNLYSSIEFKSMTAYIY